MSTALVVGAIGALIAAPGKAHAVILDLTSLNAEGTINGALFQQVGPTGTGTGHIDTFVEVQSNDDVEEAYNTTVNNTFDNGSSDVHNHAVLLSDIPLVNIGGTDYRQFLLDINETGNGGSLLSLDEIQVFQSGTPNQSVETFSSGILALSNKTLVYRLDAGGNNWIKLDAGLVAPGSGQGDMLANIPSSFFTGSGQYVYLYSKFGLNDHNDAGFEEWAPGLCDTNHPEDPVIPEPSSLWLLQIGALGLIGWRRRS